MAFESEAIQVLTDYYSAFSTLNFRTVLPYFHEPSLLISPPGVFAALTHAILATAIEPIMEGLRARNFGRSELNIRHAQSLNATATLVTGVALRYKVDGQELERVGVTYVLHKSDNVWKIAVLIIHDPDGRH